jgi:3-hydroxyisobutyrate dehydrogenase-like beta-hydroxyacid dehydrogenase
MTHSQTSTRATETVAVLGAGGTMGFAMARNIARAGLPVRAWNRSRDKAEPLAKDASLVRESASQHGLDLPLLDLIARRLHQGAADHGDEDFSATYLTSTPDRAA